MSNANPTYLDGLFQPVGVQDSGTDLPKEPKLNFIGMTVTDDPTNERVNVTGSVSKLPFGPSGSLVTPPDVSAFSLVNPAPGGVGAASAASIANHPSGYGIAIYGTSSSAHECFCGVFMAHGASQTLIVQVDAPYWDSSPDGVVLAPPFGGIILYSASLNKSIIWGPYAGGTPSAGQGNGIYLFHQDIAGASTTASFSLLPGRSTFPIWLKWHDDGAVNFNFSYSFDGDFTHAPTVTESRTAFLSDAGTQVGVGCNANQATGTRTGVKAASLWLGSWNLT